MALFHPNDRQDENIDIPDDQTDKRDDSEEISTVGIGNSAEGCLISIIISPHNHEAEMDDRATDEDGEGLLEGQRSNHLENGKAVIERNLFQGNPLCHK